MSTAFDTFPHRAFGHFEGQVEDMAHADIVSRVAVDGDIGYGLGVIDTGDRDAKIPTAFGEKPTGITLRETVRDNPAGDSPTPVYPQDHEMSVMRVGRIWVKTDGGASLGDSVYVIPSTGVITNTENTGTNPQLVNAEFKTSAAAGEMALVQLNGTP